MRTYGNFQWELNKPVKTSGNGELCSPGWLHFYEHPLLAILHNSLHADIENPRLFRAKVSGKCLKDGQLKIGYTHAILTKELPLPKITLNQKIAYAILCAKAVYKEEKSFIKWADNWLGGKNRTVKVANAATYAAVDINLIKLADIKWADNWLGGKNRTVKAAANINLIKLAEKAMRY